MASNIIYFKNPNTGETRKAPVGYSWTVFFFCFIPPLFRSDLKWAFNFLIINIVLGIAIFAMVGVDGPPLEWFIAPMLGFFYNKLYIEKLVGKGFYALGVDHGVLTEVVNTLDASIAIPILEEPQANQKSQEPEPKKENSTEDKLRQLNDLKENNLINDKEYNQKKEKLLEEL